MYAVPEAGPHYTLSPHEKEAYRAALAVKSPQNKTTGAGTGGTGGVHDKGAAQHSLHQRLLNALLYSPISTGDNKLSSTLTLSRKRKPLGLPAETRALISEIKTENKTNNITETISKYADTSSLGSNSHSQTMRDVSVPVLKSLSTAKKNKKNVFEDRLFEELSSANVSINSPD